MVVIHDYNDIANSIERAATERAFLEVKSRMLNFEHEYPHCGKEVKKLNNLFLDKLSSVIKGNESKASEVFKKTKEIKSKSYDYSGDLLNEQDYAQTVHIKTRQLLAELPMTITQANRLLGVQILTKAIESGTVGSRAVLELMDRPALSELFSENIKHRALDGSKSAAHKAFENRKATELEYSNGEYARLLNEGIRFKLMRDDVQKKVSTKEGKSFFNKGEGNDVFSPDSEDISNAYYTLKQGQSS